MSDSMLARLSMGSTKWRPMSPTGLRSMSTALTVKIHVVAHSGSQARLRNRSKSESRGKCVEADGNIA